MCHRVFLDKTESCELTFSLNMSRLAFSIGYHRPVKYQSNWEHVGCQHTPHDRPCRGWHLSVLMQFSFLWPKGVTKSRTLVSSGRIILQDVLSSW